MRPPKGKGDNSFLNPGVAHSLLNQVISELTVKLPWALADELQMV